MSKFTPEQIARTRAESERILREVREEPAPPEPEPAPAPREVPLVFEDDVAKWKREADEASAIREANRAAMRRDQRNERVDLTAGWTQYIDNRIAEHAGMVAELAKAAVEFSNAVNTRLAEMEKQLGQLETKLTQLRAADDVRRGEIIDLPVSPLIRRTRAN
jgi:hypothetical protein